MTRSRGLGRAAGIEISPHILVGHEVKTIVEFVQAQDFGLLAVGFMGHSALYGRLMGNTC